MGIHKYQLVPNKSQEAIDSRKISDELQAQGINAEVYLNHQTGECHVRWGEHSQTAKNTKLSRNQEDAIKKTVSGMSEYMGTL